MEWTRDGLAAAGFDGFMQFADLPACCQRRSRGGDQLVAIRVLVGVLGGITGSVDDGLDMRVNVVER